MCENITRNFCKIKKIKKTSNYDIPYYVTDNKKVTKLYNWKPSKNIKDILNDIYNWQINNKKILRKF